ncbi:hypothetical protein [Abyssalbus ytuae]|uniref:Uncharacterized protein n=1 Tax=Abyssalbus ytuae TaxID=2926907 RepID=A0A9E6ZWR6_9FLAO|nr:hypothetical protein [Abyssalbus ytuae]UOB16612.1 hypothetical protein MQE35_12805 [Abyssalbus ytuae]
MISISDQKKIKKEIGKNYANKILEYFLNNNILKEDGTPYSDKMVRAILTKRRYDNEKLEAVIFDCYSYYKTLNETEKQRRKHLLQS